MIIKYIFLILLVIIVLLILEFIYAMYPKVGKYINPQDKPLTFLNNNKPLTLLVMGDSTAAGQGAPYESGIAYSSALTLSKKYSVTMYNTAISGSTIQTTLSRQLPQLQNITPDVVLLSVLSNDVTHMTGNKDIKKDFEALIISLQKLNPNIIILATGSADVGSSPRFLWPLSLVATSRSHSINSTILPILKQYNVIFVPIAKVTGPIFYADRSYFSSDKFHPNSSGYNQWNKVLEYYLEAL
jgi:lysophospholipase L1-like esterase